MFVVSSKVAPTFLLTFIIYVAEDEIKYLYLLWSPLICWSMLSSFLRCVICQMEYRRGDKRITLPCKHIYHAGCARTWLSINKVRIHILPWTWLFLVVFILPSAKIADLSSSWVCSFLFHSRLALYVTRRFLLIGQNTNDHQPSDRSLHLLLFSWVWVSFNIDRYTLFCFFPFLVRNYLVGFI